MLFVFNVRQQGLHIFIGFFHLYRMGNWYRSVLIPIVQKNSLQTWFRVSILWLRIRFQRNASHQRYHYHNGTKNHFSRPFKEGQKLFFFITVPSKRGSWANKFLDLSLEPRTSAASFGNLDLSPNHWVRLRKTGWGSWNQWARKEDPLFPYFNFRGACLHLLELFLRDSSVDQGLEVSHYVVLGS